MVVGTFIKFDIEFVVGLLVNLHHPVALAKDEEEKEVDSSCGLINIDAVQQVIAAKWAVDVINNQSLPHELKIGEFVATLTCSRICILNRTMMINTSLLHLQAFRFTTRATTKT